MKTYLNKDSRCKTFISKSPKLRKLINQALNIISTLGIPLEGKTPRSLEKMAVVFIALAQVNKESGWIQAKDSSDGIALKSRDIIDYMNENLRKI